MAATPISLLDGNGLDKTLEEIFAIVEQTYIRRSTYETAIEELSGRIDALNIYDQYPCDISTGDLIFTMPDDASVTMAINSSGELELTVGDTLTEAEEALSRYNFDINSNGYLILTIE